MPAKSALEALDAALETGGSPPADETEEVVAPEVEETETGEDSGEAPEIEETETEETPEEETTEDEVEETEEDETDEEIEETPEAKAEREATAAAEKAAAAKPIDLLNDPIPKDLNKRTQARITGLVDRVRDLEPRAQQGDELIGYINESGMTADEFSMALTFGKFKHSDSVEDHRKAYAILWQGLKELAPLVGETLPGVDPLEGHQDLQARVTAKTLDPKDAAEIAAGRNRQKADVAARTRAAQNAQTSQQRVQESEAHEARVRQELNELGAQLLKTDPHFEAKMGLMSAETKAKIARSPAGLRVNAFLKAFLAIKVPTKPAAQVKQKQQPMRAGKVPAASGGGVKREAKSAVEAVDFALGLR